MNNTIETMVRSATLISLFNATSNELVKLIHTLKVRFTNTKLILNHLCDKNKRKVCS